jgi:hypothetical protein
MVQEHNMPFNFLLNFYYEEYNQTVADRNLDYKITILNLVQKIILKVSHILTQKLVSVAKYCIFFKTNIK